MNDQASTERKELLGALNAALIESRRRWQELVHVDADAVFETDESGILVFLWPDEVLGHAASELIGMPSEALLAEGSVAQGFNPFHPGEAVRGAKVWLRRGDGGTSCCSVSALPTRLDGGGVGGRGLLRDVTEQEQGAAQAAALLRRQGLIDRVMQDIRREALAERMAEAATAALLPALGAEGAAVFREIPPLWEMLSASGHPVEEMRGRLAQRLLAFSSRTPERFELDHRPVLLVPAHHPAGPRGAVAVWRIAGQRPFDDEDLALVGAVGELAGLMLAQHALQAELASQARTDPLTGLLNRRAFLADVEACLRSTERGSSLLYVDLDRFKQVNDALGHDAGDQVLRNATRLLQETFRPTDRIARLGGDEFAIWLDGAGEEVAERRGRQLAERAPVALLEGVGPTSESIGLSVGWVVRDCGSSEDVESMLRRADARMYRAKREGRGERDDPMLRLAP